MKQFLVTLPRNFVGCFKGWRIVWHLLAIALTYVLVTSGFDWRYFLATRSPALHSWMHPAVRLGAQVPVLLPLLLLAVALLVVNAAVVAGGWAIAQAEVLGALISMGYKALTGRIQPPHGAVGEDISHLFRFGFLRGGVFWGWPSTHTTIAFAMAGAVFTLCPKHRWVGLAAILYAFYVGVGVSMMK
jgi:membrane-associated phospholipid phosphatase